MTSPETPTPEPRRLRRSATEHKIAGVAGGAAEYFGLDPTLVRIGFAVMSLVGGIGLAAYAVAVFVMPAADGAPPLTTTSKVAIAAIAIAALFAMPFAGVSAAVLLVPAAIGVLVWRAFGGEVDPRLTRASLIVVTVAGALVLGAAAGVAAAFGADTAIAVLVILAGLGLIAAGLRGGARWLIVPAMLLAVPASVVSAADLRLDGGVGERTYRPSSVSELRPVYRLGAGELRLDLRDVSFEDARQVDVDVRVGVGDVEVIVPDGVCVQSDAHLGVGLVDLLGRVNDGVDVDAERDGAAAAGQSVLRLHLHGGAAELRVDRTPQRGWDDEHSDHVSDGCRG
jgi:phage shock protein PspC (stress-responsive transcriptional regulator)